MKTQQVGFSLIELLIAIVIIGILATLAITSYSSFVISSKRTDARSFLQNTASTLEKCKSMYGSYNSANCSISNGASITTTEGLYSVAVTSAASTFSLTASPVTGKSQANDTVCTSLSLNNLGQQTGQGSDSSECW